MKKYLLAIAGIMLPAQLQASVVISEIMFDPAGTDTKHEWVELRNTGDAAVSIASLRFLEEGVSHKITSVYPSDSIAAGGYAVIVTDPDAFLADFPDFENLLLDSAFSLSNTGETLSVVDASGSVHDSVTYDPLAGGKGTGNSLQLHDDAFIPGRPTPGRANVTVADDELQESEQAATSTPSGSSSSHSSQNEVSAYVPVQKIKVTAGRNRLATVYAPIEFFAEVSDDSKSGGSFVWNMGDGGRVRGRKVKYEYAFPGKYNVVLNSIYQDRTYTARTVVDVIVPQLEIQAIFSSTTSTSSDAELPHVLIANHSAAEVNIGGWILEIGGREYELPRDTILAAGAKVPLLLDRIRAEGVPELPENIRLMYPGGRTAARYNTNENAPD